MTEPLPTAHARCAYRLPLKKSARIEWPNTGWTGSNLSIWDPIPARMSPELHHPGADSPMCRPRPRRPLTAGGPAQNQSMLCIQRRMRPWPSTFSPAGPDFCAEVRGVDFSTADRPRDAGGDRARHGSLRRLHLSSHRSGRSAPHRIQPASSASSSTRPSLFGKKVSRFDFPELFDAGNLDASGNILIDERRRLYNKGNALWHTDSSVQSTPLCLFAAARSTRCPRLVAIRTSQTCAPPTTRFPPR